MGENALYVIVTGSRELPKRYRQRVRDVLTEFVRDTITGNDPRVVLIHGKCPTGVDLWADEWARSEGHDIDPMPADWKQHGQAAGPIRNRAMIRKGRELMDAGNEVWVVGFLGGDGTVNCWNNAVNAKMYRMEVLFGVASTETIFYDGEKAIPPGGATGDE